MWLARRVLHRRARLRLTLLGLSGREERLSISRYHPSLMGGFEVGCLARNRCKDPLGDTRDICTHVAVPEAQHRPAPRFQIGGAEHVLLDLFRVVPAIKLHDQPFGPAGEIDDMSVDHKLAGEPGTLMPEDRP